LFNLTRLPYLLAAVLLLLFIAACGPARPPVTTPTAEAVPQAPQAEPVQPELPGLPAVSNGRQWPAPPPMTIDPNRIYRATFRTERGDVVTELFADRTPVTVNNLVFLAREGFYDNTTFHRVIDDFMVQGGDPTGTGMGGPGYRFEDEIIGNLTFDEPGLLAMANSGPGTNGSQFFITLAPTPWLDGRHTIFGKVIEGMDVLDDLTRRDPQQNPGFTGDVLETVIIEEVESSVLPPPPPTPAPLMPVLEPGRPLSGLIYSDRENIYNRRPALVIDTSREYVATVTTTQGEIVIRMYPQDAPENVNNFVVLAELGYWDDFPIVYADPEDFVVTGSPAGRPDSDIGYTLPHEVNRTNVTGAVGFYFDPNRGATSGSQFYILLQDAPNMDMAYTVFGEVIEGLDVARSLTQADHVLTVTIEPSLLD
jgi:cyclophilin family peptidyl-prolyl cis-trans isomerase